MTVLDGVTVIELATQLPGPYAGMLLADLGARVIKVEPPEGDPLRTFPPFFASVNRGKESLSLNLKTEEGRQALAGLFTLGDIVLEGFRPGVAARLGVDYEAARSVNQSIVYCSISGFGQQGPYRLRSGHDLNYVGMAGLLGLSPDTQGAPAPPAALIADMASGLYASTAVLAALTGRMKTGRGRHIDLSMTETALNWMAPEIHRMAMSGETPEEPLLNGLPHYGVFRTADGGFITLGVVYEAHFWRRLCDVLGLASWRDLSVEERLSRKEEIQSRLSAIFLTATRYEWDRRLQEADIPCGPVYQLHELKNDTQFIARGVFSGAEKDGGFMIQPPYRFSDEETRSSAPAPEKGEHTRIILRSLGYSETRIDDLFERGVAG